MPPTTIVEGRVDNDLSPLVPSVVSRIPLVSRIAEVVCVIPIVRNRPFQRPSGSIIQRGTYALSPVPIVWVVSAVPFAVYGVILCVYTELIPLLQPS